METETIQQNVIADMHLPTRGGESSLIGGFPFNSIINVKPIIKIGNEKYKIKLCCKECDSLITIFNPLNIRNKKFCDDCVRLHRNKRNREWRKKNKQSCRNYEVNRVKYKRERRWKIADEQGIFVEHRYEIKNCVICGQNISMYSSNSKYCCHCAEKQNSRGGNNAIGTTNARQHMIRKYDHRIDKVVPNFKSELMFLVKERKALGLPRNKELNKIEFDNYYPGWIEENPVKR